MNECTLVAMPPRQPLDEKPERRDDLLVENTGQLCLGISTDSNTIGAAFGARS